MWWPMFGKGKGKGKGRKPRIDPSMKIWVGNIPEGSTWKELQEIGNTAGKTRWVEVFKGKGAGTGVIAYKSTEEVEAALGQLQGAALKGTAIQVDRWVKAEPTAEPTALAAGALLRLLATVA